MAYPVPLLTILKGRAFDWVGERLKAPILDVELLLVHQTQGGNEYSDSLSALMLTSDDVATKYQLNHHARLLRPMSLESTQMLSEELDIFSRPNHKRSLRAQLWATAWSGGRIYPLFWPVQNNMKAAGNPSSAIGWRNMPDLAVLSHRGLSPPSLVT